MGEETKSSLITMEDVDTMFLTPASRAKFLEWCHIGVLRKAYLASAKAEVVRNEPS